MSCTAAHLRSRLSNFVSLSDMIEGSYRSWDLYTTGQLVDGLQQKRKPLFIKWKWNHIVFSRATILSFHPVLVSSCARVVAAAVAVALFVVVRFLSTNFTFYGAQFLILFTFHSLKMVSNFKNKCLKNYFE